MVSITVVSHHGDLASRWSLVTVVSITVVSHHDDLYYGGLSSRWSLSRWFLIALSLRGSHRSLSSLSLITGFSSLSLPVDARSLLGCTHGHAVPHRHTQHAEHKVSLNLCKAGLYLKRYWLARRCQDLGEREAVPFVMQAVTTRVISALRSAAV